MPLFLVCSLALCCWFLSSFFFTYALETVSVLENLVSNWLYLNDCGQAGVDLETPELNTVGQRVEREDNGF